MTSILDLLKLVVKYGGLNLVMLLVLSWLFQQYFDIEPETIAWMLKSLLWYAFFETVFVMIVSRVFWVRQKERDFQKGEDVVEDIDSQSVSNIGKDIGLNAALTLATTMKGLISKASDEKERKALERELSLIKLQIALLEASESQSQ